MQLHYTKYMFKRKIIHGLVVVMLTCSQFCIGHVVGGARKL